MQNDLFEKRLDTWKMDRIKEAQVITEHRRICVGFNYEQNMGIKLQD